jgi:aarF domain-containing kinase
MHGSKSRPWVWEGSTDRVLVMEHMGGTSVGEDAINRLPGGPK